ncbi:MAG: class I SAM-dependent methyltransferase [Promethearchaeota archaeon]
MLNKEQIYRDTKIWYTTLKDGEGVSKNLIDFVKQYAGKKVLDFGCATGAYCLELNKQGFECFGVDVNKNYINIARKKGVEAYAIKERLPFDDYFFDTVIMFELLEHVKNPEAVLTEAKRVAQKNILVTVPDCSEFDLLRSLGLTYEHFLELDHVNFFTKKNIENLMSKKFAKFKVKQNEPIFLWKEELPRWASKPISLLYKLKFFKTKIYYRLYIIIDLVAD